MNNLYCLAWNFCIFCLSKYFQLVTVVQLFLLARNSKHLLEKFLGEINITEDALLPLNLVPKLEHVILLLAPTVCVVNLWQPNPATIASSTCCNVLTLKSIFKRVLFVTFVRDVQVQSSFKFWIRISVDMSFLNFSQILCHLYFSVCGWLEFIFF